MKVRRVAVAFCGSKARLVRRLYRGRLAPPPRVPLSLVSLALSLRRATGVPRSAVVTYWGWCGSIYRGDVLGLMWAHTVARRKRSAPAKQREERCR